MYLFFDTETTGKPKNYNGKMTDVDNWPRVTQLAYVVLDAEFKEINKTSTLIKPDGWEVPKEFFFIDNNMSTERCEAEGVPMPEALDAFTTQAKNCDIIIAHNIAFDYNVLGAEMIRYSKSVGKKMEQVCTMKSTTDLCKIPGPYGNKWPTLQELHKFLFGEHFDAAHDALADVLAMAKCYVELRKNKLLTEPKDL